MTTAYTTKPNILSVSLIGWWRNEEAPFQSGTFRIETIVKSRTLWVLYWSKYPEPLLLCQHEPFYNDALFVSWGAPQCLVVFGEAAFFEWNYCVIDHFTNQLKVILRTQIAKVCSISSLLNINILFINCIEMEPAKVSSHHSIDRHLLAGCCTRTNQCFPSWF